MIRSICVVLLSLLMMGCSDSLEMPKSAVEVASLSRNQDPYFAEAGIPDQGRAGGGIGGKYRKADNDTALVLQSFASADDRPTSAGSIPTGDLLARKIIYNANVYLIVENFDDSEKKLRDLIQRHQGRIAGSDTQGTAGAQRSGHWKVRIPVEKFEAFKQDVEKIGNLERSSVDSKDVTEEYYDVEARIKNKKVEETRLINHLEKTTGKLSDILEVERELSRVRGEIEQMQGRLNMLTNLTSLTTVDVFIREVKNYIPPTAPTYGDEVNRTFSSSWTGLVGTGKNFSLKLIGAIPWLPIWLVVGLILYVPVCKIWRWGRVRLQNMPLTYRSKPVPRTMP